MIPDPLSVTAITSLVVASTPHMLEALRGTLLDRGKEFIKDEVPKFGRDRVLHLDEKEQRHHLEQALKNAVERGLIQFESPVERDRYRDVLANLFEPGEHSKTLQQEALHLFSFSEKPDFSKLNDAYNRSLQSRNLTKKPKPKKVDTTPYLTSFFDALIAELYADPYFKQQMSSAIQMRAAVATMKMQQSVLKIVQLLREMNETLTGGYSAEQLEQDLQTYTTHLERSLRYLKIAGVVPTKDRSDKHIDPKIHGIFVPLRVELKEQEQRRPVKQRAVATVDDEKESAADETPEANVESDEVKLSLEQCPYLVLLGGPGSGKSTITRHMAWSHAAAHCTDIDTAHTALLARRPFPLRIELRRLVEDRRRHEYDFLSYATEVILKREGVEVHPQMFKELLARKAMVLLFDGLDEVATLDERRRLVEEIEGFALRHPGNYVLVTSRPVGYELAPISSQWFAQAQVQEFDDAQIRQFLERWYAHVLRLSPLPSEDRQELEVLCKTLQDNPRLHKLAVNPLLLTVITALHRYERLPDRRILVYDRCADLLLDTWARLKGTDARWQNMRMSKDDQYACVAHLAYVLHRRSQEENNDNGNNENTTSKDTDVPSRFLLREIERFLKDGGIIKEVADQRREAERFLELMQVEAGLIVERGTGENDETLYGFVHRTFQEYFAAVDVHKRYLQEEVPTVINDFLAQHLHDPHWQEVILLLLGRLENKPRTVRLQQILNGKIVSRRSQHTDILQQDIFFISTCLEKELVVETNLAETVVERLVVLVKTSPFTSQRSDSLRHLGTLLHSRQYATIAQNALMLLATEEKILDIQIVIDVLATLYTNSPTAVKEQVIQVATDMMQRSELAIEQVVQVGQALYAFSPYDSEERRFATTLLLKLAERADLAVEQMVQVGQALYAFSPYDSEERRFATTLLLKLAERPDLAVEQMVRVGQALYAFSLFDLEERRFATTLLLKLAERPDLSVEQMVRVGQVLYESSPYDSEERRFATTLLLKLAERPDLSVEQMVRVGQALYRSSPYDSEERRFATTLLLKLAERPDLSVEQMVRVGQALYRSSPRDSEEERFAATLLLKLAERPDLSVEQMGQVGQALYRSSPRDSEARRFAATLLLELVQRADLAVEQSLRIAQSFNNEWSAIALRRVAAQLYVSLIQQERLAVEKRNDVYRALRDLVPQFDTLLTT